MNNTPSPSKYTGRSLEDLKSSHRAVQNKIDNLRMEAAQLTGILPLPEGKKFWLATEIDWNDPRLDHIREKFYQLLDTAYELQQITGKLEAEANGTLEQYELYTEIDRFLNSNFKTFPELVAFYKKNNLTRGLTSLREKVQANPDYLQEVTL